MLSVLYKNLAPFMIVLYIVCCMALGLWEREHMYRKIYQSLFCCLIMQIVFWLNGGVDYKVGKKPPCWFVRNILYALQISSAFSHKRREQSWGYEEKSANISTGFTTLIFSRNYDRGGKRHHKERFVWDLLLDFLQVTALKSEHP